MAETNLNSRTHPLIVIAATALILTCLLAVGVMTGVVPSPLNKPAAPTQDVGKAPGTGATGATTENRLTSKAPARRDRAERQASTAGTKGATGTTSGTASSQTVAGAAPSPAVCAECGTVTAVRTVTKQGDASMIGPAAGGLIGGVLGHQIGSGSGNTIATIGGAAVGAAAGTEIERRSKTTQHYVVDVRMNDGAVRHFNYRSAPAFQAGDRVRVEDGRLVRG